MFGYHVNHADNTVAAGYAHVLAHAVGASLVDGDEVIPFVKRVGYYLGGYQFAFFEHLFLRPCQPRRVFLSSQFVYLFRQFAHGLLQIQVAHIELLVYLCQAEIVFYGRVKLIHLAGNGIG